jgi:hypothetical protein
MDNNPETTTLKRAKACGLAISYQIVPGTFYGSEVHWIYESHDGAFQKHWGPYWSSESAQAQIQAWPNWTK